MNISRSVEKSGEGVSPTSLTAAKFLTDVENYKLRKEIDKSFALEKVDH